MMPIPGEIFRFWKVSNIVLSDIGSEASVEKFQRRARTGLSSMTWSVFAPKALGQNEKRR